VRAKEKELRAFFQSVDVALRGRSTLGGRMQVRGGPAGLRAPVRSPLPGLPCIGGCCERLVRGAGLSARGGRQERDREQLRHTAAAAAEVHERLCDSVDTRGALDAAGRLMAHTNEYVRQSAGAGRSLRVPGVPACGASVCVLRGGSTSVAGRGRARPGPRRP